MKPRFVITAALAGLVATSAAQAQTQPVRGMSLELTPYAGYMMFGKMVEGPIGTSVSNANSPLYGAQLGLSLTPNIGLVGNVAYASSDLKIGVPFLGGLTVGDTKVLLYDGSLQLRLPTTGTLGGISPFVQLGAGAIRYEVENGLIKTTATNAAFNAGVGLDYQLTKNLGVRLMAKDYIGKFDFKDATTFDLEGKTAHNVALSVGVKLGF
jgi:opacity protein-like surface antigen